jgi:hypothetical protein
MKKWWCSNKMTSFLTFMFQLITSLPPQNKSFWQQLMPPSTRRIHNAFLLFCCCYSSEQVRGPCCYLLLNLFIYISCWSCLKRLRDIRSLRYAETHMTEKTSHGALLVMYPVKSLARRVGVSPCLSLWVSLSLSLSEPKPPESLFPRRNQQ